MLALVLLLVGCFDPTGLDASTDGDYTAPIIEDVTVKNFHESETYVYQSQVDETWLSTGLDAAYLILANKVNVLGEDYAPASLVRLDASVVISWQEDLGGLYLETVAAQALYEMIDEMRLSGVKDIWVTSAYRDYAYQKKTFLSYLTRETSTISEEAYDYFGYDYLYNNYISKGERKLTAEDARKVVLSYSAAPGTSEHQTGLCVDFTTESLWGALNVNFENTEAFAWLSRNAYKFGFILRYPETKETLTGYTYEPWHYRFVGREAATDIHCSGLTLEEYLVAIER